MPAIGRVPFAYVCTMYVPRPPASAYELRGRSVRAPRLAPFVACTYTPLQLHTSLNTRHTQLTSTPVYTHTHTLIYKHQRSIPPSTAAHPPPSSPHTPAPHPSPHPCTYLLPSASSAPALFQNRSLFETSHPHLLLPARVSPPQSKQQETCPQQQPQLPSKNGSSSLPTSPAAWKKDSR